MALKLGSGCDCIYFLSLSYLLQKQDLFFSNQKIDILFELLDHFFKGMIFLDLFYVKKFWATCSLVYGAWMKMSWLWKFWNRLYFHKNNLHHCKLLELKLLIGFFVFFYHYFWAVCFFFFCWSYVIRSWSDHKDTIL